MKLRLGGKVFPQSSDPRAWARAVREAGFSAAWCPVQPDASDDTVAAYAEAASRENILIAEVCAWSNPLSPAPDEAQAAVEKSVAALDLADRIGSCCCVNIAGTNAREPWFGPHEENFSRDTFDRVVETTRRIIDAVQPTRTAYSLEMLPWAIPDGPETYIELIEAVDRPALAVHLDLVNILSGPRRLFDHRRILRECIERLGWGIRSVHLKDIRLSERLTVHLDECPPGEGMLDWSDLLKQLDRLPPGTPALLEHLPDEAAYRRAADFIRNAANRADVTLAG
jgi:sugar phosphate isomerase/epimerase